MIVKMKAIMVAVAAVMVVSGTAMASQVGPVKVSLMNRVESHSKISDSMGRFSGETFGYTMLSFSRALTKKAIGNIYYLNQYSFDESDFVTHIGGLNLVRVFNANWIGTLGYTYSSKPQRSIIATTLPLDTQDRFSSTLIWNVNPKSKGLKWSSTTGYSTVTDFGEQQTINEKIDANFPIFNKRWSGNLGYNYTYSLRSDEQLTNQFSGNLSYQLCKDMKLTFGAMFIDNTYNGNQGDDTVGRITLLTSLR